MKYPVKQVTEKAEDPLEDLLDLDKSSQSLVRKLYICLKILISNNFLWRFLQLIVNKD